jgi:hypothetical protein
MGSKTATVTAPVNSLEASLILVEQGEKESTGGSDQAEERQMHVP